ncbi:SRPBCC domain-containing protein [Haloprofundus sp. MHR1]|uniref:SRPBCC domain-containing protein n=1 Tax=Haloprofundus sp. MHR1 TaxID=2572921 RepID=UPI0010BE4AF2|nr:SRPBCC domain-containing protein [Haloprofundus sp. MHR1]QCJ48033.1 SRPBCC domain-containing protein [Haloprofundus sp. MHR1]
MNDITTAVDIDAPPETVWRVLTDFESYPDWNPYTVVSGRAEEGTRLRVSPGPEAGRAPTFRPRVLRADPNRELRWIGHLYVRGLFDGEHRFVVESRDDDRSRLVQSESFSGVFAGPILRRIGADTEANFRGVNEALKARAEALWADRVGSADSNITAGTGESAT